MAVRRGTPTGTPPCSQCSQLPPDPPAHAVEIAGVEPSCRSSWCRTALPREPASCIVSPMFVQPPPLNTRVSGRREDIAPQKSLPRHVSQLFFDDHPCARGCVMLGCWAPC